MSDGSHFSSIYVHGCAHSVSWGVKMSPRKKSHVKFQGSNAFSLPLTKHHDRHDRPVSTRTPPRVLGQEDCPAVTALLRKTRPFHRPGRPVRVAQRRDGPRVEGVSQVASSSSRKKLSQHLRTDRGAESSGSCLTVTALLRRTRLLELQYFHRP